MNAKKMWKLTMELVEASGKSVRQIEREAGLSNGMIGQLPKRKNPSIATVKALADYFGKPIEYFIG